MTTRLHAKNQNVQIKHLNSIKSIILLWIFFTWVFWCNKMILIDCFTLHCQVCCSSLSTASWRHLEEVIVLDIYLLFYLNKCLLGLKCQLGRGVMYDFASKIVPQRPPPVTIRVKKLHLKSFIIDWFSCQMMSSVIPFNVPFQTHISYPPPSLVKIYHKVGQSPKSSRSKQI